MIRLKVHTNARMLWQRWSMFFNTLHCDFGLISPILCRKITQNQFYFSAAIETATLQNNIVIHNKQMRWQYTNFYDGKITCVAAAAAFASDVYVFWNIFFPRLTHQANFHSFFRCRHQFSDCVFDSWCVDTTCMCFRANQTNSIQCAYNVHSLNVSDPTRNERMRSFSSLIFRPIFRFTSFFLTSDD